MKYEIRLLKNVYFGYFDLKKNNNNKMEAYFL